MVIKTQGMQFRIFLIITILVLSLNGCKKSDDAIESWEWTHFTEFGRQPIWSPDGSQVLFGDDHPGSAGLYLWDLNAEPILLHAELPAHNWDYCWSPDGSHIAFTSPGGADETLAGVWSYSFNDGSLAHLFDRGRDVSWLYNNSDLAFRVDNPEGDAPGIYRLRLPEQGGTEGEADLLIANGHKPRCSPQSDFIAYSDGEINGRLHIINLDLDEAYQSEAGVVQWNWSYDGSRLAFILNNYTTGVLSDVLWGIDVTSPEEADTLALWATYPASDQRGDQIVFVRVQNGRLAGLWIYRTGEEELRIATYGQNPSYDPTAERIAANSASGGIQILTRIR